MGVNVTSTVKNELDRIVSTLADTEIVRAGMYGHII